MDGWTFIDYRPNQFSDVLIHKVVRWNMNYCMFEMAAGLRSAVNMDASFVFIFCLNMKMKQQEAAEQLCF